MWRDTGRYREIPGDTRGYDEIRSPHDVFTTTSVKLIGRDGRNFALRPAVICRAAKRSIPMIGESSSSSMKHRKDSLDRRPGGWSPAAGGLSRSGGERGARLGRSRAHRNPALAREALDARALRPERGEAGLLGVRRAGYGRIWRDMAGYGGIWSDMVRYGQIWSDMERYIKIPQKNRPH